MKKRMTNCSIVLACILTLLGISIYSIPKLRVTLFVKMYHEVIEEGLEAGHGVPADDAVFLGYKVVNSWDNSHPMTEFVLIAWGNTYYGCYYSPDNVPLAFQNTDVELTQNGHDYWEWSAEGDNHGETSEIMDCWYFFKASF